MGARYRAMPTSPECAVVIKAAKRLSDADLERLREWCTNSLWQRRDNERRAKLKSAADAAAEG